MAKPSRNGPCPCGSGKKYKKCCLPKDEALDLERNAPDRAVGKALQWLMKHHGDEVKQAIDDDYCAILDEAQLEEVSELPEKLFETFQLNAIEWALAEGGPEDDSEAGAFMDLVLSKGLDLDPHERRYLELLSTQPLDLYEVAEVESGKGLWLVPTLTPEPQKFFVREVSASRELKGGEILGARIIPLDLPILSGAIYSFNRPKYLELRAEILEGPRDAEGFVDRVWVSECIIASWLELLVGPAPRVTDASTGEPILLTKVHYRIEDWDRLVEALSREADVERDQEDPDSFQCVEEGADEVRRTKWAVSRASEEGLELFARTAALADEGEERLSRIASAALTRIARETTDPRDLWKERPRHEEPGASTRPSRAFRARSEAVSTSRSIDESTPDGRTSPSRS